MRINKTILANKKEKRAVCTIYSLLILMICIDAFLSSFVVSTLIRGTELFSLTVILFNLYRLKRLGSLHLPQGSLRLSVLFLFAMIVTIVARGNWNDSMQNLLLKLLDFYGFLSFVLPFIIIPLPNARHLDIIKKVFFIGALISIPLWILNIGQLVQDEFYGESVGMYMPVFAAFLLGFPFVKKSNRRICFAIWAIYIVLMALNARRNMMFLLFSFGAIAYYCNNLSRFAKHRIQGIGLTIAAIIISILLVVPTFDYLSGNVFGRFSNHIGEDTRSSVEELFLLDFTSSPIEDWIWGRGLDGSYYQEMINYDTGEVKTDRSGIETGYLNNILKGGVLYASAIVVIMLACLFRSIRVKNIYSVYLRLVFLMFFVDLYSTVLMGYFGVKSVLFWFCVSLAMSREYPHMGQTRLTMRRIAKSKIR